MAHRRRARDLRKTAIHEAGHAVIAQVLEIKPRSASIVGDETSNTKGRVLTTAARWLRPDGEVDGRAEIRLHREIMVCLAGVTAERRFTGRNSHVGASHDYAIAADLAIYATTCIEETNALLKWLGIRTESLVSRHWRLIEGVADALLATNTLNAAQITAAIRKAAGWSDADSAFGIAAPSKPKR